MKESPNESMTRENERFCPMGTFTFLTMLQAMFNIITDNMRGRKDD